VNLLLQPLAEAQRTKRALVPETVERRAPCDLIAVGNVVLLREIVRPGVVLPDDAGGQFHLRRPARTPNERARVDPGPPLDRTETVLWGCC